MHRVTYGQKRKQIINKTDCRIILRFLMIPQSFSKKRPANLRLNRIRSSSTCHCHNVHSMTCFKKSEVTQNFQSHALTVPSNHEDRVMERQRHSQCLGLCSMVSHRKDKANEGDVGLFQCRYHLYSRN